MELYSKSPKKTGHSDRYFEFLFGNAKKLKQIIAQDRNISDRDLSKQMGISAKQLDEVKLFCKMNGMSVNGEEPKK